MNGTLTDVHGIKVGHYTDLVNATGCTVIIAENGAVPGVDVRGAAPGTRETDLIRAENTVETVHAVVLSGGSAFGLDSASGVMQYLAQRKIGHKVGKHIVPIVPAAIIFDLNIGNPDITPSAADGYFAASVASNEQVQQGSIGAGTGATVGKALGIDSAMKGGLGSYSIDLGGGVILSALVVVNAVGGVHDITDGSLIAGPRAKEGKPQDSFLIYSDPQFGFTQGKSLEFLGNTTIGVVATNVNLTKAQASRLATVAHDGLALSVRPTHTVHDGDTIFALSTGLIEAPDEFARLIALAPLVVSKAIISGVREAASLGGFPSFVEVNGYE
ncbi:MAG: P1 family peptidase [SAR202 cluster bacterium]|nr:P1 family peptidase [SAR202 cluster bacterium]